jgi:hypothetical protein
VRVVHHKQCDIIYKLLETLLEGLLKIHIPQSKSFINTDYHRSQKFCVFVKCEQHSTRDINLDQVPRLLLDLPLALHSLSLLRQWPMTSEALKQIISFPPQEIPFHRTSTNITMFRETFQEFLSWIKRTHPKFSFHFIKKVFCIIFKSVRGSIFSTVTRIYDGRCGVQISAGARDLFSKTSRPAPVPSQPPTQWKPDLYLWQ